MLLLALCITLGFIALIGVVVALVQAKRWRGKHHAMQARLRNIERALEAQHRQQQQTSDELYVMQSLLIEHNVVDQSELSRGHYRLVQIPRRQAQERLSILCAQEASPTQVVIGEDSKVH